jgi:hypothetical protein
MPVIQGKIIEVKKLTKQGFAAHRDYFLSFVDTKRTIDL